MSNTEDTLDADQPTGHGSKWFVDFAVDSFGLDRSALETLAEDAAQAGAAAHEFALRRGVIDHTQADIVETLAAPHERLPDFEFLGMLGRGAMGVVYKARQLSLDRIVAVKTILVGTEQGATRFEAEARMIARLRHPNIVTAFDLVSRDGRLFLVLELLEGETLQDRLRRDGQLDERLTWQLIRQTAAALSYAAGENTVHRDIKPGNLFLVDAPSGFPLPPGVPLVKVTDFGLAAMIDRNQDETQLTIGNRLLGTPAYMAPEQLEDSHVDHRADLYALGATAYHMLAGEPTFAGESFAKLLAKKAVETPPPLGEVRADVSPESSQLIDELLRIDPTERLGDYSELITRIDEILGRSVPPERTCGSNQSTTVGSRVTRDEQTSTAQSAAGPVGPTGPTRRWLWPAVGGAVLLLIVLALLPAILPGRGGHDTFATPMRSTGQGELLFDGISIAGWRTTGGSITPTLDGEGGNVLEINGTATRTLPDYEYFTFRTGIDLRAASRVNIWFGDHPRAPPLRLRLTRDGIQVTSTTDENVLAEHTFPADPWRTSTDEEPNYRELVLQREPGRWLITFGGATVTEIAPIADERCSQLVVATDAACRLEAVEIEELKLDQ